MDLGLPIKGRGASWNPANRFERLYVEPDPENCEVDPTLEPRPETHFYHDRSQSFITYNNSPDLGFGASFNPYRGCEHGCVYCFARPTHEYLGMSAGLDFETRILIKANAPALLRKEFASKGWKPQVLMVSGVTDCYQPVERRLKLTRKCLEVLAEVRNPAGIVTKNQLVTRDVDILKELARYNAICVTLSVTSLRIELAQKMEPRTSMPQARLDAIRTLAKAGVPVGVNIAPIIPGLTDYEMPDILKAAADAGATHAGHVFLRLPHAVAPMFERWLGEHAPDSKEKVLHRIKEIRGGKLYDSNFETRMKGEGVYADQINDLFQVAREKAGIPPSFPPLSTAHFRKPAQPQLELF